MAQWITRAGRFVWEFGNVITAVEILNEANKSLNKAYADEGNPYMIPVEVYGRLISKFTHYCKVAGMAIPSQGIQRPCAGKDILTLGLHPGTDDSGDQASPQDPQECGTHRPQANNDVCFVWRLYDTEQVRAFRMNNRGQSPFTGVSYHPYPYAINPAHYPNWQTDPTLDPAEADGYTHDPDAMLRDEVTPRMDRLRDVLRARGDRDTPFWLTEVGMNARTACDERAGTGRPVPATFGCGLPGRRAGSRLGATPVFTVVRGSPPAYFLQVEQGDGKIITAPCYGGDYTCRVTDTTWANIPSTARANWRWRVRGIQDWSGQGAGPWSQWRDFTPLIGATPDIYGPQPGQALDFNALNSLPVAIPADWITSHPGAQPYLTITDSGGRTAYRREPLPRSGTSLGYTFDREMYVFGFSGLRVGAQPGEVTIKLAFAPAVCADDITQCRPIDEAHMITRTFTSAGA